MKAIGGATHRRVHRLTRKELTPEGLILQVARSLRNGTPVDRNNFSMLCLALSIAMPVFQIYRMKDGARQSFRAAAHTAGLASIKPKDYEKAATAEGSNAYRVWADLCGTGEPLEVGDVLEAPDGSLRIYKYVGFEEARWVLPEVKTGLEGLPGAAGGLEGAAASV